MNEHIGEFFVNGYMNDGWELWIKKMNDQYPEYLKRYG